MQAYENLMYLINKDKYLKADFKKEKDVIYENYPIKKIEYKKAYISYPKSNYIIDNNYKKIEHNHILNKTISEIYDMKSIKSKPSEYYQYNMENRNISELRLSNLQKDNNILSNFELLKEENESNNTLDELKEQEEEYQTNLSIVLNKKNENQKIIESNGDSKYDNDVKKINVKYKKKIPILITKAIPYSLIKQEIEPEPITQFNTPLKQKKENDVENELQKTEALLEEDLEEKSKSVKISDPYNFPIGKTGDINSIRYDIFKFVTDNFGLDDKLIENQRGIINQYLFLWGLQPIKANAKTRETIRKNIYDDLMAKTELTQLVLEKKDNTDTVLP